MIPIPLKYTAKIDLATPLQTYLQTKYSQAEATRHHEAVSSFQALRNDVASIASANEGAREALLRYYFQSEGAKDKFPVSESNIKIPFVWTDSLKPTRQISQFSWAYERASVLYNIAALTSHEACITTRDTPEGIQKACQHFCTAAGILNYIKTEVSSRLIGTLPYDLTSEGLSMLMNVQLAQAQACYYEMAQSAGKKPETLAKIAGQAGDLYRAASRSMSDAAFLDVDGTYPWTVFLRMHAASFDSASFWQQSHTARAEADVKGDGYGLEIAWLTVAENAGKAAINIVGSSKNPLAQRLDVTNTSLLVNKVHGRRAEAEKDNNTIYCNPVPAARDLPDIQRAVLAKPLALPVWLASSSPQGQAMKGRDLFASIVPVEVSAAMGGVEDQLSTLAQEAKDRGNKATEEARNALQTMGLPGYLEASENGGAAGVPPALWERIRKTQINGGLPEIERMFAANAAAGEGARVVLAEVLRALDNEASADGSCRRQFGERWTAAPSDVISAELRGEVAKYQKVSEAAAASDSLVRTKVDANRDILRLINGSKTDLDATIPAGYTGAAPSSSAGSAADAIRGQLKDAVAQLNALCDERSKLANGIKEKFDRNAAVTAFLTAVDSAVTSAAVAAASADGSAPVGSSSSSGADIAAVQERVVSTGTAAATRAFEDNLAAASRLLETIRTLHARFSEVKMQDERTVARERALQRLSDAVDRFEEIRSNLKEGDTFYRDLKAQADRLLVTAQDLAAARGLQQRELMLNIRAAAEAEERSRTDADMAARMASQASISAPAYPPTAGWNAGAAAPTGGAVAVPVPLPPAHGSAASVASSMAPAGIASLVPQSTNPFDSFDPAPAQPSSSSGDSGSGRRPALIQHFDSVRSVSSNPSSPKQQGTAGFVPNTSQFNRNPMMLPAAASAAPVAAPAAAMPHYPQQPQQYHQQQYQAPAAPMPGYGAPPPYPGYGMPAPAPHQAMPYGAAPMAPQYGMAPGPAHLAPQQAAPVSPALAQLLGMGFPRPDAERALARTNDVGAAVQMLLDGRV